MTRRRSAPLIPMASSVIVLSLIALMPFALATTGLAQRKPTPMPTPATAAAPAATPVATSTIAQAPSAGSPWQPLNLPVAAASGQPSLAVDGSRLILSWLEPRGRQTLFKFSERTATGWSAPRIVSSGRTFFVNAADVPSVRPLADGSLAAHWLQTTVPGTEAYDLQLSFSRDGGRSWRAPVTPHHDGTKTQHGFASLFPAPGTHAGLGLIWLDGRATTPETSAAGAEGGAMTLRGALFSADGKQTADALLNASVCDCCPTAAAITSDGPIIAFRNRDAREVRDIHVSRFVDGRWAPSTPVYEDNWVVPVCPVNGPALAADGRRVAIAWFTMRDGDEGHTFVAFSEDAGRTFSAPVRVDDAMSLGRSDIALLPDGSAVVSWVEYADDRADLRLRLVRRDGTRSANFAVAGLSSGKTVGLARLARVGNDLLFAWTDTTDAERTRVKMAQATVSALR